MKKLQRHFAPTPAAISETGGRNGTKSLADLSEIPTGGDRGIYGTKKEIENLANLARRVRTTGFAPY
jgi:hypothetical protein